MPIDLSVVIRSVDSRRDILTDLICECVDYVGCDPIVFTHKRRKIKDIIKNKYHVVEWISNLGSIANGLKENILLLEDDMEISPAINYLLEQKPIFDGTHAWLSVASTSLLLSCEESDTDMFFQYKKPKLHYSGAVLLKKETLLGFINQFYADPLNVENYDIALSKYLHSLDGSIIIVPSYFRTRLCSVSSCGRVFRAKDPLFKDYSIGETGYVSDRKYAAKKSEVERKQAHGGRVFNDNTLGRVL